MTDQAIKPLNERSQGGDENGEQHLVSAYQPAVDVRRLGVLLCDTLRVREERFGEVEVDLVAVVDHQEAHMYYHLAIASIFDLRWVQSPN